MSKTLFIGGIKSGKSRIAEQFILKNTQKKPYYLATTEFIDQEMAQRINEHQLRRQDTFHTIEEPLHLLECIQQYKDTPILVECVSMWINNMIYHKKNDEQILTEIKTIVSLDQEIVFVLNDVSSGVVPDNALARHFVDISGKVSQHLAQGCTHNYFCIAGQILELKNPKKVLY